MKYYRLKHDTPEVRKDTIFREKYDGYSCDEDDLRHSDQDNLTFTRKTVEEMPYWFEEVTPTFLPVKGKGSK